MCPCSLMNRLGVTARLHFCPDGLTARFVGCGAPVRNIPIGRPRRKIAPAPPELSFRARRAMLFEARSYPLCWHDGKCLKQGDFVCRCNGCRTGRYRAAAIRSVVLQSAFCNPFPFAVHRVELQSALDIYAPVLVRLEVQTALFHFLF